MLAYFTLFFMPSFYSLLAVSNNKKKTIYFCFAFSILCILILGTRHKVGGDWINYLYIYNNINDYFSPFSINFLSTNYLFDLINYLSFNNNLGFVTSNIINQIIFIFGLFFYAIRQSQPSMIFVLSVPYLIIVVSTGYVRQASALGIILVSLPYLFNAKFLKFSLLIFFATLFHKTAFIMLILIPVVQNKFLNLKINIKILISFILIIPFSIFIYFYLLQFQYNYIIRFYVGDEMHFTSTGAIFRYSLFFISAILCLFFRNILFTNLKERKYYVFLSVLTLAMSLFIFKYSSAVDRILIYFYPLQLFVLSRLHTIFSDNHHRVLYNILIIFIYLCLLLIWAHFGKFSNHWIPFNSKIFL